MVAIFFSFATLLKSVLAVGPAVLFDALGASPAGAAPTLQVPPPRKAKAIEITIGPRRTPNGVLVLQMLVAVVPIT